MDERKRINVLGFKDNGFPILDKKSWEVVEELHESIVETFPEINQYEWGLAIVPITAWSIGLVIDSLDNIPAELEDNIVDYIDNIVEVIYMVEY